MLDFGEEQAEPFRVTPGFLAFLTLLFAPVIISVVVFAGAWAVADEVRGAEASPGGAQAGFNTASEDEVAGWKRALVGICPLH